MIPIGICSVVAMALILDRVIYFLRTHDNPEILQKALQQAKENHAEGLETLRGSRGDVAALWQAGLEALGGGKEVVERAMKAEGIRTYCAR